MVRSGRACVCVCRSSLSLSHTLTLLPTYSRLRLLCAAILFSFRFTEKWLFILHMHAHTRRQSTSYVYLIRTIFITCVIAASLCMCVLNNTIFRARWRTLARLHILSAHRSTLPNALANFCPVHFGYTFSDCSHLPPSRPFSRSLSRSLFLVLSNRRMCLSSLNYCAQLHIIPQS